MGKFSQYSVPLDLTQEGVLKFEYNLDDRFFELIDGTVDVRKGQLKAGLTVKQKAKEFELNFDIQGYVKVPCDRCLDDVSMDVETKSRLIVKFGTEYSEESDEIVVIPEEDKAINVAWFIFEFIALSLPGKKVHAPGTCNKAMSAKYNKHRTEEAGDEDEEDIADEEDSSGGDSRWDSLKELNVED